MGKIKYDKRNYRKHNDKNKRIIRKSLEDCGAGRSVLVDKDNVLIAGNGVYEQAHALGIPVRIVESDGSELVVVKRTDLKTDDEKRKLLALADNHASDTSEFDFDAILSDFEVESLTSFEFDMSDFNLEPANDPNKEFKDLGEFDYSNVDLSAWKSLIVNFENPEDYVEFAKKTELVLTEKTRSVYYPQHHNQKVEESYSHD